MLKSFHHFKTRLFSRRPVLLSMVCATFFLLFATPLKAEGLLSRIFFFQRPVDAAAQKERATKDLLSVAIDRAVYESSQVNGFYHEPNLKIKIPDQMKKIESLSRKFNVDLFWHDIELGLNRAAEKAAPKVGVLMKSALEDLKFEKDPEKILKEEGSMAAYFHRKMQVRLSEDFKQEIERSVGNEIALAPYVEMKNIYSAIPFVKNSDQIFMLEDAVSRKALEGIFLRIKEEENRLRSVRTKL